MPDNLKITQPLDKTRINIHEPWEVNWWCNELGCTKDELVSAVRAVGTSAKAVRAHLGK